jgi:hypothetical protein
MAHKWRTKSYFQQNENRLQNLASGYNAWSARRELNPQPSESEVKFADFTAFYKR